MTSRMICITAILLLAGCQPGASTSSQPEIHTPAGVFVSATVLRRLDYTGLTKDDKLDVNSAKGLATLVSFFPSMGTKQTSAMHGGWTPWVVIRFHTADGKDVVIGTDYRIYRVGDGESGDFVIEKSKGFHDYIDQIYADPSLVDRTWVKDDTKDNPDAQH